jgi:threonyl-tRNA synthetase
MATREEVTQAISSKYIILSPDGTEMPLSSPPPDLPLFKDNPGLHALVKVELAKGQPNEELRSIRAMQELELVDYEPASDKGHFRFYPKGALVFDLLRLWAEEIALVRLQAYQIETPILYNWDEPDIRAQAESFHERHYRVLPPGKDSEFILRFAGDFGLFRMMKDAQLTHRHLPVRLYEFSPSFRYEQSGELSGLQRLRGFWMPDIHSFCVDLPQGLAEYGELYRGYTELANGTGVQYAVAFRVVESFYRENREAILKMVRYGRAPVFIELLSEMKHYWVMKHEINTIDGCGGVCQTSTVQLDIKDAAIYGITYIDQTGERKGCTIVHSSIGSPERWIFSILEDALKKKVPVLPLWLAPIQVRLIPLVAERHLEYCQDLARMFQAEKIRVDIDDRPDTLSWRIRAAEREWVPYTIVCGDKEQADGSVLPVRIRGNGQKPHSFPEIADLIKGQTKGMPFRFLPGTLVSKRPVFRGGN